VGFVLIQWNIQVLKQAREWYTKCYNHEKYSLSDLCHWWDWNRTF